jgi:hypothetical protein
VAASPSRSARFSACGDLPDESGASGASGARSASCAADWSGVGESSGDGEPLRLANGTKARALRLAFISPKEYSRKKKKKMKLNRDYKESLRRGSMGIMGS